MDQGKLNPGERIEQLRNEAKNPNRSMLRHTHFGTKGGNRTLAASARALGRSGESCRSM
jgi:hypothetical protein